MYQVEQLIKPAVLAIIRRKLSDWTDEKFALVLDETLRMIQLGLSIEQAFLPCNADIDAIWHEMILETQTYRSICHSFKPGGFLDHTSVSFAEYSTETTADDIHSIQLTYLASYVANYGAFTSNRIGFWVFAQEIIDRNDWNLDQFNHFCMELIDAVKQQNHPVEAIDPAAAVSLVLKNQALSPNEQLGYLKSFHARLSHSNKLFSDWVDRLKDCENQTSHDWLSSAVASLSEKGSSLRVADAGCGTGELLSRLASEHSSCSFSGIDVSEEQIAAAQANLSHSNIDYTVADMGDLPFETGVFEAVVSHYTLMLFVPLAESLAEINRITKANGRLFAAVPCYWQSPSIRLPHFDGVMSKKMRSIMPSYPNIGLMNGECESENGIKQALSAAGFTAQVEVREYSAEASPEEVLDFVRLLYPYDLCPVDQRAELESDILTALRADAGPDGKVRLARCVALIDATKY